jgi:hypothetical protein
VPEAAPSAVGELEWHEAVGIEEVWSGELLDVCVE